MNTRHQRKFKVFANGVALALAEVIFWVSLFVGYYSIKRIAPNVQLENEAWWAILPVCPFHWPVHVGIAPETAVGQSPRR